MKRAKGQGMVEFALILPIFLALMAGLVDGCRLLYTYNDLQEAARMGARWAAVEVNRDSWGTFQCAGNKQAMAYAANGNLVTGSDCAAGPGLPTIVGQAAGKLIAINRAQATVTIALPASGYSTCERQTTGAQGTALGDCTGMPVTVSVAYTFKPVLGFGAMGIQMVGKETEDHE